MADRDTNYSARKPTIALRLTAEQATMLDEVRRTIPNADGGLGITRSEYARRAIVRTINSSTGADLSDEITTI